MLPPITDTAGQTREQRRDRLVFYPVAAVGGVFCITVLMTIAAAFSDPQSPAAQWFQRYATRLLIWESAAVVAVGILAMAIDRIRTLRKLRTRQPTPDAPADAARETPSCG